MYKRIISGINLVFIILFFHNCEMDPVGEEKISRLGYVPKFVFIPVRIPEPIVQAQDSMVQHLASVLEQFNKLSEYTKYLEIPEEKMESASEWPRSWSFVWDDPNGTKVTFNVWYNEKSSLTAHNWLVKLNGEDSTTGINYNNFEFINAEMDKHGSRPVLLVYKPGIENYHIRNSMVITSPESRSNNFYIRDETTSWQYYIEATKVKNEMTNVVTDKGHLWYTYVDICLKQVDFYWEADGSGRWSVKEAGGSVLETGEW